MLQSRLTMEDAPQRDHHSPVQQELRDPPPPTRPRQCREGRGEPPSSDKGPSTAPTPRLSARWSVGAVSAWRAHNPVSLLHSGCECDDLWSLRKGLKHAETGCGSANLPPPSTHTHNTPRTHTHAHSHSSLILRGPAAEATHTSLHQVTNSHGCRQRPQKS